MAGFRRLRTNAQIKGFYKRASLLASRGVPWSLKVTMMRGGAAAKRGGYISRLERARRKLKPQGFTRERLSRLDP